MAKPEVDSLLRRLGYDWHKTSAEIMAKRLQEALEQAEEIWALDVYASNDGIYTTYRVRFPGEEELEMQIKDVPSLVDKGKRIKRLVCLKYLS